MKYTAIRTFFVGDINAADWTHEADTLEELFDILEDTTEAWEEYDEMLDEVEGEFMGYRASEILKNCDPTAYRCGFSDFDGIRHKNIERELEGVEDGYAVELYGYTITAEVIEEEAAA